MTIMIKKSVRFEDILKKGLYIFHVHSNFTDGKSTIEEYCDIVERLRFKSLIITEHVNREIRYDFDKFMGIIEEQRLVRKIKILAGIETKVLEDGSLDMPEWIHSKIDVLAIAEHSFNGNVLDLKMALLNVFKKKYEKRIPRVWVHPGLKVLNKFNSSEIFKDILKVAIENKIYIEKNFKYKLPPIWADEIIPKRLFVTGLDAHSIDEIGIFAKSINN